jgi:dTDP-4-dehydrorhamnose reductase
MARGHDVFSSYKEHPATNGNPVQLDQTHEGQVKETIARIRPQAIINTAALSDVDFCEENPDAAFLVNSESVAYLATAAREAGSFLLQVSTDYVFDGEKGSYSELDPPHPVNMYGNSKLQGERAAVFIGEGLWSIARPSVIFGWGRPHRPNAATYVFEKLSKHETVRMVQDQYSSPTFNTNLAAMLVEVAERKIPGILHTAGATRLNRYELALRVAEKLGLDKKLILPTAAGDIPWKAKRPKDSSLIVARAASILSWKPLPITDSLDQFQKEKNEIERRESTITREA